MYCQNADKLQDESSFVVVGHIDVDDDKKWHVQEQILFETIKGCSLIAVYGSSFFRCENVDR